MRCAVLICLVRVGHNAAAAPPPALRRTRDGNVDLAVIIRGNIIIPCIVTYTYPYN